MVTQDDGMKKTSINGIKTYTIASQQPLLASWLPTKKQSSHHKVKSYTQSLQLLKDLRFTTAAIKIKATLDGEYIVTVTVPTISIEDFVGVKYRMGRDMTYDCWSYDLLCATSSPNLYRINLEQLHGLVACGGDDDDMEFFDMRVRSSVRRINDVRPSGNADQVAFLLFNSSLFHGTRMLSEAQPTLMNKIKELIIQCELKSKECYEAWMSLTTTNEHLEAVQMELDKMTFKLEIKQATEGFHHVPGVVEAKDNNIIELWNVLQAGSNAREVEVIMLMSIVVDLTVMMLDSEISYLPIPRQVGFMQKQYSSSLESSSQEDQCNPNNNVTLTQIQGR
ncbi:hypothetical protein RJT34_12736 [Clitoria ternatea]|uniref:Uncharacterized protein n=1 Tax=Clitoria ternatea TaxID=43366 RepID=A0AAN9JM96_CLITE